MFVVTRHEKLLAEFVLLSRRLVVFAIKRDVSEYSYYTVGKVSTQRCHCNAVLGAKVLTAH